MSVGPWEIIMMLMLLGLLIIPLIIVVKIVKIEKRINEIEDHISASQPEEDW